MSAVTHGATRTTIDDLLAHARAGVIRVGPQEARTAMTAGALLLDVRSETQRASDGVVAGSIWFARNVLEWRCDPVSEGHDERIADFDQQLIVMCDEGYQSSLAAATLRQLGFARATDLAGGFRAWRAAGLPVACNVLHTRVGAGRAPRDLQEAPKPILSFQSVRSVRSVRSVGMDELDNPFRPGAGTAPPALVGRDSLITGFRTTVGRAVAGRPGQSVMPIGLRGVGKTVLLNRFTEIAEDEGLHVGYIEAPETGDLPRLLVARLRTILLALDRAGKASRVVKRALGALRSFTYTLPDGSSISLGADPIGGLADSGQFSEDLTDVMVAVGEAARDRESGIVLAIDEVQYLSEEELAALISAIHRTVQLNLPVVLVGAGLPQLPGLTGNAKSYAERLFRFPQIGSLEPSEAREVMSVEVV